MFTFLVIVTFVVFVLLVVVTAMRPMPSVLSGFELERRAKRADQSARNAQRREKYLPDVISLQRVIVALLLVVTVLLSVVTFGWVVGSIIAVLVALEYGALARFKPLARLSQRLYERLEPSLLTFTEKASPLFLFLRGLPSHNPDDYRRFDSREELQRLIDEAGDVLTQDERRLLTHGLSFGERTVESVMTPRNMIDSIKKTEFLGPLVLSELHDLGHSRLPVIGADLDHVVGTLHLRDLLTLDTKRSVTAEKAMETKVFYIRHDQTLEHALAAFLKTHHHLFIVINELRETVGLLTLEDVIEALIGRKIVDEDDNHEDLRAMAAHKAADNNRPEEHVDV